MSRRLVNAFMIAGAALRLWQYAADGSLWLDEIALARNILGRPLGALLTAPLAFDQAAPWGFLLAEKLAVMLLGPSDLVLRLVPLLGSLAALVAFGRLAERLLQGMGPAIAMALFAGAAPLVVYAAQAKQYALDVAAAVLLTSLALRLHERGFERRRVVGAGAAGALAVWVSHPAALVLAGLGLALILLRRGTGASVRPLAALLSVWGLSALGAAAVGAAMVAPATMEYMRQFWAGGMMPHPLHALRTLWPLNHLSWLVGMGGQANLGYPAPPLYLALMLLGLGSLWRRQRAGALLLLAPIAVTLAAAAARRYPLSDRLALFLLPALLLGLGEATERVRGALSRGHAGLGALGAALIVAPALAPVVRRPPPYRLEETKPALARLAASRRPGDRIYVYYGAGPAVIHYGARYGLDGAEYSMGGCHRGDSRRYLEELDHFRGQGRVWILIAHSLGQFHEREDMVRYLDAIGTRTEEFLVPARTLGYAYPPVELDLYDLSHRAGLRPASAASFPLTGPSTPSGDSACDRGPLSMVVSTVR